MHLAQRCALLWHRSGTPGIWGFEQPWHGPRWLHALMGEGTSRVGGPQCPEQRTWSEPHCAKERGGAVGAAQDRSWHRGVTTEPSWCQRWDWDSAGLWWLRCW